MSGRGPFLGPALAGAAATFSSVGLARFAYVPLFPLMVAAQWVDGGGAALLGAANLAGYLIGVLSGRRLARRIGVPRALDIGMAATALSFAASGFQGGLVWLALWRGLAGVSGGILMALAGPAVQAVVGDARRGVAGGVVIAGVPSGIVVSSLAVPLLAAQGLSAAWLSFAVIVLALWLVARRRWPDAPAPRVAGAGRAPGAATLIVAYGLAGAGMVPHMVYLADYSVRGHGHAFAAATAAWLLFGLGALGGTLTAGGAADRFGAMTVLRVWLALQATAIALVMAADVAVFLLGALLGGFGGVGATAVTLARAREIAGDGSGAIWQQATAAFAVSQAGASLGLALVFAKTGDHDLLFAAGLAFSVAALLIVCAVKSGRKPQISISPP